MILHYYRARSGSPAVPVGARFSTYSIDNQTSLDETVTQQILGDAGDILTIQVSSYVTNNGNSLFKINGVTKVLNDTVSVTLNGSGTGSISVYFKGGNSSGNVIIVTIQITAASGTNGIGNPATHQYSKAV